MKIDTSYLVFILYRGIFFSIEACDEFCRRHVVDIEVSLSSLISGDEILNAAKSYERSTVFGLDLPRDGAALEGIRRWWTSSVEGSEASGEIMSIKRLKHHAQNLGQMFCGWELMFDYKRLAEMEEGILHIDMLTEECFHNGQAIDPLRIVDRLRDWMLRDLEDHNFPVERLECVELNVKFRTRRQLGQKIKRSSWNDATPHFIHCTLDCSSRVKTQSREFVSSFSDEEEWPESYTWIR